MDKSMKYIRFLLAFGVGSALTGLSILALPVVRIIPIFNNVSAVNTIPIIAYFCSLPLIMGFLNERKKPKLLIDGICTNYLKGESSYNCYLINDWKGAIKAIMNEVSVEGFKFSIFEEEDTFLIYKSSEIKFENRKKRYSKQTPVVVEFIHSHPSNELNVISYKNNNFKDISNYEVESVMNQIARALVLVRC